MKADDALIERTAVFVAGNLQTFGFTFEIESPDEIKNLIREDVTYVLEHATGAKQEPQVIETTVEKAYVKLRKPNAICD